MIKNIKSSGFTLIELIIVIIILGVLSAVAIPSVYGHVRQSKVNTVLSNLKTIEEIEYGIYSATGYVTGSAATENDTDFFTATTSAINNRLGNIKLSNMNISIYSGNITPPNVFVTFEVDYAALGLEIKDFFKDGISTPYPGLDVEDQGFGAGVRATVYLR